MFKAAEMQLLLKKIFLWRQKMRKNFGAQTALFPMPVFIIGTYDENMIPDAMNAAWGGISEENEISICVSAGHKTTKNLLKTGAFTVSIADEKNMISADYVGIVSGNDVNNKIENANWTVLKSEHVNAPLFEELPLALECRVKSYDENACRLVGEIVNLSVDESILDEDGEIDMSKFVPITYNPFHHTYIKLGETVGTAFSDGKILEK